MKARIFIWQDPVEEVAEVASEAEADHAEADSVADTVEASVEDLARAVSEDRDPDMAVTIITITDRISIIARSLALADPISVTDTEAVALAE